MGGWSHYHQCQVSQTFHWQDFIPDINPTFCQFLAFPWEVTNFTMFLVFPDKQTIWVRPGVVWAVADKLMWVCWQSTSEELWTSNHEAVELLHRDLRTPPHTAATHHHWHQCQQQQQVADGETAQSDSVQQSTGSHRQTCAGTVLPVSQTCIALMPSAPNAKHMHVHSLSV